MDNLFSIFDEGKDFQKLAIEKINAEKKILRATSTETQYTLMLLIL